MAKGKGRTYISELDGVLVGIGCELASEDEP